MNFPFTPWQPDPTFFFSPYICGETSECPRCVEETEVKPCQNVTRTKGGDVDDKRNARQGEV